EWVEEAVPGATRSGSPAATCDGVRPWSCRTERHERRPERAPKMPRWPFHTPVRHGASSAYDSRLNRYVTGSFSPPAAMEQLRHRPTGILAFVELGGMTMLAAYTSSSSFTSIVMLEGMAAHIWASACVRGLENTPRFAPP